MLQNRILWNLVVSIIMAWLYNRTNGSIMAPALFHVSMNTFGNQISMTPAGNILLISVAVFAIVYDRMWKKLPANRLAVYQERSNQVEAPISN
jgi:membrane protease YdiL (CAAX protease family)